MDSQTPSSVGPCLKKYFNNKSLSDAVIRCGGREFPIHRLVLCSHSDYFTKQLDGPWKESSERVVEITDFDASLVEAMIYFAYHLNYDVPNGSSAMLFNAGMYQMADKYAMSTLKTCAQGEFNTSIEKEWQGLDFAEAISLVYASTPPCDRGLKDIVVSASFDNLDSLMVRDEFKSELASNADFSVDIIQFQMEKYESQQCHTCRRRMTQKRRTNMFS